VLPTLPPNCFLIVNVNPHLLTQPELAEPLLALDDLAPLVLELTEHRAVGDLRPLADQRDRLWAGALPVTGQHLNDLPVLSPLSTSHGIQTGDVFVVIGWAAAGLSALGWLITTGGLTDG
jgi:hypothetical protein